MLPPQCCCTFQLVPTHFQPSPHKIWCLMANFVLCGREGMKGMVSDSSPLFLFLKVRQAALALKPGLLCVACGSYRRGKPTCGDVDVLVTHPDGQSHRGVFNKLLDSLRRSGKRAGGWHVLLEAVPSRPS